jgi:hypothetical protein
MNAVRIYPCGAGWMFEVWTANRLVVIGTASTRARAEREASLA